MVLRFKRCDPILRRAQTILLDHSFIKRRKNCESCPTQVTWKVMFKSVLSVLSFLSFLSACLSCLSFGSGQLINQYGVNIPPLKKLAFKWRSSTGTAWFVNIWNNVSGHNPSFLSTLTLPPALKRGQFECRDQFWTRLLSILSFWYTSYIKAANKRIDLYSCLLITRKQYHDHHRQTIPWW